MQINLKVLTGIGIIYLLIPVMLFLSTWIEVYIGIPIIVLSVLSIYFFFKTEKKKTINLKCTNKKLFIILSILLAWIFLSGVGGFVWQNRWDHMFRNAIFLDLVKYDWPVVNYDSKTPLFLCYYIGYWLPAAFIAKLTGSLLVGYICQLIYGYIGLLITFLLISSYIKKLSYISLFTFIFFSGLHIISIITVTADYNELIVGIKYIIGDSTHIESFMYPFNSSSNTTLLFWLYNQFIPFTVGFMVILSLNGTKHLLLTSSLIFFCSPFAVVGMGPLFILFYIYDLKKSTNFKYFLKSQLSIPNISGLLVTVIIILYYKSNLSVNVLTLMPFESTIFILFGLYLLLMYLVYIIFVWNQIKHDIIFYVLFITMIFCSFISLGFMNDFAWRTAIPMSFYLMLIVLKELIYGKSKLNKIALYCVLCIGFATPYMDFQRTLVATIKNKEEFRRSALQSVFHDNTCYENFIGSSNSLFYKYLIRK